MRFDAKTADLMGFPNGRICPFHEANPDQRAIMETCDECIYVEER